MFLPINSKTNQWTATAAFINILLLLAALSLNLMHISLTRSLYFFTTIITPLLSFYFSFYIISILVFFREKAVVTYAFTMYLCIKIIRNIYELSAGRMFIYFGVILGALAFIVNILLLIAIFKIKNPHIKFPIRLIVFGMSVLALLTLTVNITYPIIFPKNNPYHIAQSVRITNYYISILRVITPISILLLLRNTNKFIIERGNQNIVMISPEMQK